MYILQQNQKTEDLINLTIFFLKFIVTLVKSKFTVDAANLISGFYIIKDFKKSVSHYIYFRKPKPEHFDKGTLCYQICL